LFVRLEIPTLEEGIKMTGIIGDICEDEKTLKTAASKRRKRYVEESVDHAQVSSYEAGGWEVVRRSKTKTRMRKWKSPDVLFEDRVWMIFYNLRFGYMNKDRKCKLKFNGYTKQIDVLARDDDNIFVVECRSSETEEPINARSKLEELVGKREEIGKALRFEWGRIGRVILVVVVSSQDKRNLDEEYVNAKRDKNIFLWSKRDIEYMENLINQVDSSAKYQLYSVIFAGRKQRRLKKEYLALRSKIAGRVFYSFLISAKELLRYAYVHHRHLTTIVEASQAYQRMLRSSKLKEIARFIDVEEGYFPNSIIVNFSKHLKWNKRKAIEDVAVGTVTLPEYYGCAWVVDGQHRLYGVASAEKDLVVPVLAFEDMEQKEQANLFVDINLKQKKVPADLLWDLYSDIYRDSSDEKQQLLYQITETAKRMEASGPLANCIDIPSKPAERPIKLSLTTICSTIQKYSPWKRLKHTDESKTPENAARLINSYFGVLKSLWPEDWEKGNKGVLLTNNGFGVFMMVFNDIIHHLAYKQESLLQIQRVKEFEEVLSETYLTSVIEFLKTDESLQKDIRSKTGRGPQNENAALLDLKIQEFLSDFSPARVGQIPAIPLPKEPPALSSIEEKARQVEQILRGFVLEKLKLNYGSDKWWKQGVPTGPKKRADKTWETEIKRKPSLRSEKDQNERKFEFFGLGDLIDIVISGHNWEQAFETVFIDKENFKRRIMDIISLRNPTSHARKIDDQDVLDGMGGLLWLSKCIDFPDLNPYA